MAKKQRDDELTLEGVVLEALPTAMFKVQIQGRNSVLAYLAGKMRTHKIRVLPGDTVQVVLSAYDLTRGRIVYRVPTPKS